MTRGDIEMCISLLLRTPTMSVAWVARSRLSVCLSVCLFVCLFVCLQHNSKTNDPKVFKLGTGNNNNNNIPDFYIFLSLFLTPGIFTSRGKKNKNNIKKIIIIIPLDIL